MPDDDVPVTLSLQAPDIHDGLIRVYRTADNEPFYEWAFDRIAQHLGPPSGTVLDAGCGTGTKTRHLLARVATSCMASTWAPAPSIARGRTRRIRAPRSRWAI